MNTRLVRLSTAVMFGLSITSLAVTAADARRGGSFGSRGSRTYMAPRQTYASPRAVAPVERSMTQRPQGQIPPGYDGRYRQSEPYGQPRSRFGGLGGFGGGLLGGLLAGGLLGHFLGGGWNGGAGGGGGMLAALLQLLILGGIVWLVIGFFRRRGQSTGGDFDAFGSRARDYAAAVPGGGWGSGAAPAPQTTAGEAEIAITSSDQREFERLLTQVQDAFGREDYGQLRQLTTPEIMSYLSEELSQNATRGVRNEVRDTRLIDAEVSEAWREGTIDYATIALRYESIDVMRDRTTGAIVGGSPEHPTEALEYWTFVRTDGSNWKLSAIQEG